MAATIGTSKRGFAAMAPEKRKEIARHGGQSSQSLGKGHTLTPEEQRAGGQKAGQAVSRDRAHMAEISRKGVNARRLRAEARGLTGKEA
jgi:uncharacterized protein